MLVAVEDKVKAIDTNHLLILKSRDQLNSELRLESMAFKT